MYFIYFNRMKDLIVHTIFSPSKIILGVFNLPPPSSRYTSVFPVFFYRFYFPDFWFPRST